MTVLRCGNKLLDLSRPRVMGILNVTPDSFSDGGRFSTLDKAIDKARAMVAEGAAIIDVGGESTRPGAVAVDLEEELRRVIPVIEVLARELPIPLSIDTSKPAVMTAAVAAGAGCINDVNALRAPGALDAARAAGVPVCLMHMQGYPRIMQQQPEYQDVVTEVLAFLQERISACEEAGISLSNIIIDPGFGFGKTLEHNLILFRNLHKFSYLSVPLLVGISRKSMLSAIAGGTVDQRLPGSLAAAVLAMQAGAKLLRVHDVGATVNALKVAQALLGW